MANPEHVAKLKEGVEAWNAWREASEIWNPDLSGEMLNWADPGRTDLRGVDLSFVDFSESDLSLVDLTEANLTGAVLRGVDFRGAHLYGATLEKAVFRGSVLFGADLTCATFGYSVLANLDLSDVRGLGKTLHRRGSTLGIDTIYLSGGRIPDAFLRGCGVPDTFIAYAKSLVGAAIEFYSTFISYSTKDQDVADRLHADLQQKGVRCWLATEDLKIGDKFRTRIDESIRIHDKLLLILSEQSIASPWVEDEVESALERERRDRKLVLFPIRIDDAVMETDVAWASSLRRTRHIGDFRKWKRHATYAKAFERLLRDLKSGAIAGPQP